MGEGREDKYKQNQSNGNRQRKERCYDKTLRKPWNDEVTAIARKVAKDKKKWNDFVYVPTEKQLGYTLRVKKLRLVIWGRNKKNCTVALRIPGSALGQS